MTAWSRHLVQFEDEVLVHYRRFLENLEDFNISYPRQIIGIFQDIRNGRTTEPVPTFGEVLISQQDAAGIKNRRDEILNRLRLLQGRCEIRQRIIEKMDENVGSFILDLITIDLSYAVDKLNHLIWLIWIVGTSTTLFDELKTATWKLMKLAFRIEDMLDEYLSFYNGTLSGDLNLDLIKIRQDDSLKRHLEKVERLQKEVRDMFSDDRTTSNVLIDYPDDAQES